MTEFQTTLTDNRPIVLTIGNFDGVHLGHQRLLHATDALAKELKSTAVMVTFSPHTLRVVRPNITLHNLTTLDEKLVLASEYGGVADSIVIKFTPEVAKLSAEDFMNELRSRFTIRGIIVGTDFSLGRNRLGNITFLKEYGQRHQIKVEAIDLETSDQERISSTRIRNLVSVGKIEEANALLGHTLLLEGRAEETEEAKEGQTGLAGLTTCTIQPPEHKLLPSNGIYAIEITVLKEGRRDQKESSPVYNGIASIQTHSIREEEERLVNIHVFDPQVKPDGAYVRVEFIAHLREEQHITSQETLKQQISVDVQQAHQILASRRVSH